MTKVKIKALAIDLDGTLLNGEGVITDENLEALKLLIENNIEVIPVTGRPYILVKNVFGKHDLKINHVICSNGGVTYDGNGNKISSFYMDKEPGVKLLAYLEENNFPYAIFTDKRIYSHINNESLIREDYKIAIEKDSNVKQEMLDGLVEMFRREAEHVLESHLEIDNIEGEILGIIGLSLNQEKLQKSLADLKDLENITIGQSAFNNIEANSPHSNKGQALKTLAEKLNIEIEEVMAIGDNFNDLTMLKIVKHSVAMGNAHDKIKESCSFVTKTNNESGVAHAINTLIEI